MHVSWLGFFPSSGRIIIFFLGKAVDIKSFLVKCFVMRVRHGI